MPLFTHLFICLFIYHLILDEVAEIDLRQTRVCFDRTDRQDIPNDDDNYSISDKDNHIEMHVLIHG